jgi:hypothetical protein
MGGGLIVPKYYVTLHEQWERLVVVEADDEDEAAEKAYDTDYKKEDEESFEFSSYLKDETLVEPYEE